MYVNLGLASIKRYAVPEKHCWLAVYWVGASLIYRQGILQDAVDSSAIDWGCPKWIIFWGIGTLYICTYLNNNNSYNNSSNNNVIIIIIIIM